MKVIGLTGGIASGKSTVAAMIRKLGIPVICADELAHEAIGPGTRAYRRIIREFGKKILNSNKTIHRPSLAAIVFSSAKKRKQLNQIVHPEIIREIKKRIRELKKKSTRLVVLDIPLLFEEKLTRLCDAVIVVYAPESVMKKRIKERDGLSPKQIKDRLASQWPIEKKRKKADWVIDNSGSVSDTERQVRLLLQRPVRIKGKEIF